jgi:hypothetical protein
MNRFFLIASAILFGIGATYAFKNREQIGSQFGQSEGSAPTTGQTSLINLESVNEAIDNYLSKRIIIAKSGAHVFCSKHLYGYEESKNSAQVPAYVWVYCEEYFLKDETVTMGQGVSFPIKIYLKIQNGKLVAIRHEEPIDGEGYGSSIRKMFPEGYASEAIRGYDINKFNPSPEEQAKAFYGK